MSDLMNLNIIVVRRRSINPMIPHSSSICQSQPELIALPFCQSGASTRFLPLSGLIW